ncbi:transcription antitermination factor NusB [Pararhodobacter marinus]|uniref:transcription antitermination factor NusB n=1 Tax=Pararhodobacter marinus TaxID=2184063 RepID=UPI0035133566
MPQPADPRRMAATLVAGVIEGQMLPEVPLPPADPAARARAQRLALVALRNFARTQTVLGPMLRHEPQPAVMAALRVATVEMLELGEAPHGVINDTVEALKRERAIIAPSLGIFHSTFAGNFWKIVRCARFRWI